MSERDTIYGNCPHCGGVFTINHNCPIGTKSKTPAREPFARVLPHNAGISMGDEAFGPLEDLESIAAQINSAVQKEERRALDEMRKRAEHAEGQLAATYIELDKMSDEIRRRGAK